MTNIDLPDPVRAMLRHHRHDLAGRLQLVVTALELSDETDGPEYATLELLRGVERGWRTELERLDLLMGAEPHLSTVDAGALGAVLGIEIPAGSYTCDPEALVRAYREAHRALGRYAMFAHVTTAQSTEDGLVIELRSGRTTTKSMTPLYHTLPGDCDAALCTAEARLAGALVTSSRDEDGIVVHFTLVAPMPHA